MATKTADRMLTAYLFLAVFSVVVFYFFEKKMEKKVKGQKINRIEFYTPNVTALSIAALCQPFLMIVNGVLKYDGS